MVLADIRLQWLTVTIAASLALIALPAHAKSKVQIVHVTAEAAHRPANLYEAITQMDSGVCKPIIASLNKPLIVKDELAMGSNLTGDLLLGSDLQVPWERKPFGLAVLDHAQVDLANDGLLLDVYREGYLYGVVEFQNDLHVLTHPSKVWTKLDGMPFEAVSEAASDLSREAKASLNRNIYEEGLHKRIFDLLRPRYEEVLLTDSFFNVNILSVQARNFLLVTNAAESDGGLDGHPFHVFVLSYYSNGSVSVVCEFRGGKAQ